MKKERSGVQKVFCGCLTAVAVIVFLVLVISAYAILYVPSADSLTKKLDGKESLTAVQYKSNEEVSPDATKMFDVLKQITSMELTDVDIVEFINPNDESDSSARGIVVYTDSIKTASQAMINYIKFIMDKDSKDVADLDYHVSSRGKAIFFGNKNGEIEFRKVVF